MHHATLRSAVTKYAPMHAEGQSEEVVKTAIASDEKKFDEYAVNEIYDAIVNPKSDDDPSKDKQQQKKKYVVVKPFRDIDNFSVEHAAGKDVSHFDQARLDKLVKNGHVEQK